MFDTITNNDKVVSSILLKKTKSTRQINFEKNSSFTLKFDENFNTVWVKNF